VKQRCSLGFLRESAQFSLRFTCEHCSHFQEERGICTHGYPTEVHRAACYAEASEQTELTFCKDFDLC
jgi:hypothetical protein